MKKILLTSDFVDIRAAEQPNEDGTTSLPTLTIVGYTGVPLKQPGYQYPIVVDLAGMQVEPDRTPILVNHSEDEIAGHTTDITNDGKSLTLSGVLSGYDSVVEKIVQTGKKKYPWQASIGASIGKLELVRQGDNVTVNGQTFAGPVYVARQSILREISLTPTGVDRNTSAQIAAKDSTTNEVYTSMSFDEWVSSLGIDVSALSPEQVDQLKQAYAALQGEQAEETVEGEPSEASASYIADLRASAVAETNRISAIQKVCASKPEIAARAISEGWTVDKAELTVLRASRPAAPAIHSGSTAADLTNDVIVAGLVQASGKITNKSQFLREEFNEKTLEASSSKQVRQLVRQGFTGLCAATLQAAGKHVRPGKIDSEMFRAAVAADGELRASGFSEISLGVILGNYANKILLASFKNVASAYRMFAANTNLNDFKPTYRARLTTTGLMDKIGPDGEIRHAKGAEESWSIKADTYAKMLTVSRQDILNDDLGAFDQIPADFGRKSALTIEKAGMGLVIANTGSFYSAGNKNYLSGGSSPLTIDSLTTAEALFNSQTDAGGNPVAITPAFLVVPPGLKALAEQLYNDRYVVGPTSGKTPNGNPHAGKFVPIYSPFITSTTAWYLMSDPADTPAYAVGYVGGQDTPIIEQVELDANNLGIGVRGYIDFGVGQVDFRASVYSAGA